MFSNRLKTHIRKRLLAVPAFVMAFSLLLAISPTPAHATPVSYTVTFDANGGSGTQQVQVGSSTASLPSSTTFTPPAGMRFLAWSTGASSGQFLNSYNFTADKTIYARWTGGPLVFSTVNGGSAENRISMPTTPVGTESLLTIFVINSSPVADVLVDDVQVSNVNGLSGTYSGTCDSGNTIQALDSCTVVVRWSPTTSGSLPTGTLLSVMTRGFYTDSVELAGVATGDQTVTFDKNDSSGETTTQAASAPTALTLNSWTRPGYTFAGWSTSPYGSGATYADGANFNFGSDITLFANWTSIATPQASVSGPTYPQVLSTSQRIFHEGSRISLKLDGDRFEGLMRATIEGSEVQIVENTQHSIKLDLGVVSVGSHSIYFVFKSGSLVFQDAVTVLPSPSAGQGAKPVTVRIAGFASNSSVLSGVVKSKIAALKDKLLNSHTLICIGSMASKKLDATAKALAKNRASAACQFAKELVPNLVTVSRVVQGSTKSSLARTVLLTFVN
jgi:uncharacterized repeat protein (TIGR02543 family)